MSERVVKVEATGETFIFLDEWNTPQGLVKQMKYTLAPKKKIFTHVHPNTAQFFKVVSGELTIKTGGKVVTLKPGEEAWTQVGAEYSQWNSGDVVAEVIEGYDPPINIEPFFRILSSAHASKNPFKLFCFSL